MRPFIVIKNSVIQWLFSGKSACCQIAVSLVLVLPISRRSSLGVRQPCCAFLDCCALDQASFRWIGQRLP